MTRYEAFIFDTLQKRAVHFRQEGARAFEIGLKLDECHLEDVTDRTNWERGWEKAAGL